jgi:hypothetical protein
MDHLPDNLYQLISFLALIYLESWRVRRSVKASQGETEVELKQLRYHVDSTVQKLNGTATYMIHSWPGPAWMKRACMENGEVVFRMQEINENYCSTYGFSRLDYIGKTDLEAGWDRGIANKFLDNDLKVWASGKPDTFIEETPSGPQKFLKIRLVSPNGDLKGVLGYALPLADFCPGLKDCPLHKAEVDTAIAPAGDAAK